MKNKEWASLAERFNELEVELEHRGRCKLLEWREAYPSLINQLYWEPPQQKRKFVWKYIYLRSLHILYMMSCSSSLKMFALSGDKSCSPPSPRSLMGQCLAGSPWICSTIQLRKRSGRRDVHETLYHSYIEHSLQGQSNPKTTAYL